MTALFLILPVGVRPPGSTFRVFLLSYRLSVYWARPSEQYHNGGTPGFRGELLISTLPPLFLIALATPFRRFCITNRLIRRLLACIFISNPRSKSPPPARRYNHRLDATPWPFPKPLCARPVPTHSAIKSYISSRQKRPVDCLFSSPPGPTESIFPFTAKFNFSTVLPTGRVWVWLASHSF